MDIQSYLKKEGLTQTEFASRIGVSSAAVSQWVKKARNVSPLWAKKIEGITSGAITRKDLRPDIFGKIA